MKNVTNTEAMELAFKNVLKQVEDAQKAASTHGPDPKVTITVSMRRNRLEKGFEDVAFASARLTYTRFFGHSVEVE